MFNWTRRRVTVLLKFWMIFHLFYYHRGGSLLNPCNSLILSKKEFHDVFPIIEILQKHSYKITLFDIYQTL